MSDGDPYFHGQAMEWDTVSDTQLSFTSILVSWAVDWALWSYRRFGKPIRLRVKIGSDSA